jgi:hypothetical protein
VRNFRVSDFRIDSSGFVVCKATVSCEDNSIGSGYFCSNNSVRQLRIKSVNGERMNGRQAVLWCICTTYLVSALFVVPYSTPLMAQTASGAPNAASQATTGEPDGQHDFDFAIGDWKIHLKRLEHPLTGSKTWVEFDGTLKTRKIWNGDGKLKSLTLPVLRVFSRVWLCVYTIRRVTSGASIGQRQQQIPPLRYGMTMQKGASSLRFELGELIVRRGVWVWLWCFG